jgi:hypothetical protein
MKKEDKEILTMKNKKKLQYTYSVRVSLVRPAMAAFLATSTAAGVDASAGA